MISVKTFPRKNKTRTHCNSLRSSLEYSRGQLAQIVLFQFFQILGKFCMAKVIPWNQMAQLGVNTIIAAFMDFQIAF